MTLKMERGEEGETAKGFFRALFGSFLQSVPGSVLLFLDTALLMLMRSSPSGDISAFLSYAFALLSIAAILLTAWLFYLFADFSGFSGRTDRLFCGILLHAQLSPVFSASGTGRSSPH